MTPARDVGLGTAYERWAIYRRLVRWAGRPPPPTAIEGPVDGMAGIAGLHLLPLARRGTSVTVVLEDAAARERVRTVYRQAGLEDRLELRGSLPDAPRALGVLFNHGPHVEDWRATLGALAGRVEERLVVFATHPGSYGVGLRRLMRRVEPGGGGPEQFEHEASDPRALEAELRRHGRIVAEAFVDCPWWPDLFVSAGQTLAGATVARLRGRSAGPGGTPWDAGPEELAFATADEPPALRRALRRHPHFDGWPPAVARWFAHHRAYLVDRTGMDLAASAEYP